MSSHPLNAELLNACPGHSAHQQGSCSSIPPYILSNYVSVPFLPVGRGRAVLHIVSCVHENFHCYEEQIV